MDASVSARVCADAISVSDRQKDAEAKDAATPSRSMSPPSKSTSTPKECVSSPAPKLEKSESDQEAGETTSLTAAPSTPAKQDGRMELLPLRVESSPTIVPSEFSPSTSSSAGETTPLQEPIKIQPAPELTSGYGFLPGKETEETGSPVLKLSSALAEPQIILQLASAIQEPDLGSKDLPTIGSIGHRARTCKPCAFLHTKGCENGVNCPFCHLCKPGEKKRRLKEKKEQRLQVSRYIAYQEQVNQEWQMFFPPPR